jgi:hypothetical protein
MGVDLGLSALRDDHRLRMLGGDEVTGGWRRLHHGGVHDLYSAPNINSARWAVYVARMGAIRNTCKVLVGKYKRFLGRPRRRCEDNIEMDLEQMGCEAGLDSSGSG